MTERNVRVVMEGHGRGKVYLDGQEVKGLVSISIHACVDQTNSVCLTLLADRIEFEGQADVFKGVSVVAESNLGSLAREVKA